MSELNQCGCVDVWNSSVVDAVAEMADLVESGYTFVAIDTEFPGIVCKPTGPFANMNDYSYQLIRSNVDLLQIIQLGFTFADAAGNLPTPHNTYQFNFSFDLDKDLYAAESIDFLRNSGIDFRKHLSDGIDLEFFAELIVTSGLIYNEELQWVSFHGSFDFAYLLKMLTGKSLPSVESKFFSELELLFPNFFDTKHMIKLLSNSRSGETNLLGALLADHQTEEQSLKVNSLNAIATALRVDRVGQAHQAGSDSLVTLLTWFKLQKRYVEMKETTSNCARNHIFGLER